MFIVTSNNEYVNFNIHSDSLYIKNEDQKVSIVLIRQNGIQINVFSTLIGDVKENIEVCKAVIENIIFDDEVLNDIDKLFYGFKEMRNKC